MSETGCNAVREEKRVGIELGALSDSISRLENLISDLERDLLQVLRVDPEPPTCGDKAVKANIPVPLAESINENSNRINNLSDNVSSILSRLEV